MLEKNNHSKLLKTLLLISVVLSINFLAISQIVAEKNTRDAIRIDKVEPKEFAQNRANPKAFRKRIVRKTNNSINAKPINKVNETESVAEEEVASLGVTIWKLPNRETKRLGDVVGSESDDEILAERVEGKVLVQDGDSIRFAIELPIKGYLYVFDREQYGENNYSEPYLVYPIKGVNGQEDNNLIEPKQMIYLPRQNKNYSIKLNLPEKVVAEVYTVLVSPKPIVELKPIECKPTGERNSKGEVIVRCPIRKVTKEEFDFEAKLKQWSGQTEVVETNLKDPIYRKYKTMDKAEIECLQDKSNKLTVLSPPPQRIYTIARNPNEPYMINISLEVAK